jgi:hypothetical protein
MQEQRNTSTMKKLGKRLGRVGLFAVVGGGLGYGLFMIYISMGST